MRAKCAGVLQAGHRCHISPQPCHGAWYLHSQIKNDWPAKAAMHRESECRAEEARCPRRVNPRTHAKRLWCVSQTGQKFRTDGLVTIAADVQLYKREALYLALPKGEQAIQSSSRNPHYFHRIQCAFVGLADVVAVFPTLLVCSGKTWWTLVVSCSLKPFVGRCISHAMCRAFLQLQRPRGADRGR
jgi:hypothetical protein